MTRQQTLSDLKMQLDSYQGTARAATGHKPHAMVDITNRRINELEAEIAALESGDDA